MSHHSHVHWKLIGAGDVSIGSFRASMVQKRVGTMLVCGEPHAPSDAVATQLVLQIFQQIIDSPEPITTVSPPPYEAAAEVTEQTSP